MKSICTLIVIASFFSLLPGCALQHHPDVRPGVSGTHTITLSTEDKTSGYSMAKPQIDFFCEEQHKSAYVVDEQYHYTGSISEADYHAYRAATRMAQSVGAAGAIFSTTDSDNASAIASVMGDTLGSGYRYTLSFQCQ